MNANRLGGLIVVWICLCHSAMAGDQPVAHWTFDDGVTDSRGHTLEAFDCDQDVLPMVNAGQLPGVCGRALALGIGDAELHYLTTETTADLKPGPVYTLEAWIVPTRADGWRRLLLLWGDAPRHAYHLALHNGRASLAHGQADGEFLIAEGGSVETNCLNHLVGLADGERLRVFLNARQVANIPYDGTIAETGSMRIGVGDSSVIPNVESAFNGYIDELRIYDRALSDNEVRDHFQTTRRREAMTLSHAHRRVTLQRALNDGLTDDQSLLDELLARGVEQVVLARRGPGRDVQSHYYANFGYSSIWPDHWLHAADGGQLISLDLKARQVRLLVDDPGGNVRDPRVHYDGRRILFS